MFGNLLGFGFELIGVSMVVGVMVLLVKLARWVLGPRASRDKAGN